MKTARAGRWWRRALAAAATLGALALALWYGAPWLVALPELAPLPSTRICDREGVLLGLIPGEDYYRCEPLPAGAPLPQHLAEALMAIEDHRFPHHGGVDLIACARALKDRLTGGPRSGASTLAMQLAKIGNGAGERSLSEKLREMLQARRMVMQWGRERLLREYLNRADFGNLCRGAESAALYYYGCPAAELAPEQAALLAALVQGPTRLNPLRHPQAALARRNLILRKLGRPELCALPLGVRGRELSAPAALGSRPGQLTIDAALQAACRRIAREEVERLRHQHVTQAAVVVVDNRCGDILVRIGAALPESPFGGRLDASAMPRSAGSTLKPFAYLMGFLREGQPNALWAGSVLADVPTLYRSAGGTRAPENYLGRYLGPITVRQALACSQNVPAMEVLNHEGGVEDFLALLRQFGYAVPGEAEELGLGLAIGNAHVTLLEQVRAYSALARGGSLPTLRQRMEEPVTSCQLPLGEHAAQHLFCLADIMSDPVARTAGFGSAPRLRFPFRCALKTGTSSNYRDNWCIGFTARYTVGVWVGNTNNAVMHGVSGVSGAGPIFHRVFKLLATREPQGLPPRPEGLTEVEIDRRTGLLPREDTPPECRWSELVLAGQHPTRQGHYDAQGRALLDARYADWLASSGQQHLYALDAATPSPRKPSILIPARGTELILDPTLPDHGRETELVSTLPAASARWHCRTLRIFQRGGRWWAELRPGQHRLLVEDPQSGQHAESTFTVRSR